MDFIGRRRIQIARPGPEAKEPACTELQEGSWVGLNVLLSLPGLAAGIGHLSLGDVARQFLLIEHGENRLVQAPRSARPVSHPQLKADRTAQRNECVKPVSVADGPRRK